MNCPDCKKRSGVATTHLGAAFPVNRVKDLAVYLPTLKGRRRRCNNKTCPTVTFVTLEVTLDDFEHLLLAVKAERGAAA